jgi:hypothetical protein
LLPKTLEKAEQMNFFAKLFNFPVSKPWKNTLTSIRDQALPFSHQPADRVPHGDVLGGLLFGRVAKSCRCLGV